MKTKRKLENNRQNNTEQTDTENTEPTKYISIPYIPQTSETLRRIFSSHNIKCAFYSNNTLRKSLSKPKDKVPLDKQNNIVYQIPCNDCPATYIGESKRTFDQRSKEHKRAVKNGDTEKNEIADHCWSQNHSMNWENRKIIDRETYTTARKIKETIHSIADNNHINSISYVLPDIWLPNLQSRN